MKIADIAGARMKHGNVVYEMTEAKFGSTKVWPLTQPVVVTYVITNSRYVFSNGGSVILASGTNYVTAWGTVEVRQNGVTVETLYNQRLDVSLPSGSIFYVSNNEVHGNYLADTDNSGAGDHTSRVYLRYNGIAATEIRGLDIDQQINSYTTSTTYGPIVYDDSTAQTRYTNYVLAFTANNFYDVSHKCPASGGSTALNLSASHHVEIWKDYTRTDTVTYTYKSGYVTYSYPVTTGNGKSDDTFINDVTAGNTSIIDPSSSQYPGFSRNGMTVTVASELWYPYDTGQGYGRSAPFRAVLTKQDGTTIAEVLTIYQAINALIRSGTEENTIWDDEPTKTIDAEKPNTRTCVITLASAYEVAHPAPAAQSYVGFGVGATHIHEIEYRIGWHKEERTYEVWSSGTYYGQWQGTTSGSDRVEEMCSETVVNDTPTVTFNYNQQATTDWLTWQAQYNRLLVASEGTTARNTGSGYGRSCTINAANGSASDSKTLYQEVNAATMHVDYILSLSIGGDDTLPASGGSFPVFYSSFADTYFTYTSGESTTPTRSAHTSQVSASSGCSTSVSQVSGGGTSSAYFTLTVPQNPSTSDMPERSVTITAAQGVSETASKYQDAAVPVVLKEATLEPYIWTNPSTGPYIKGHLYYLFAVESGSLSGSTLNGVELRYKIDNSAEQTYVIGNLAVEDTGQSGPVEISGQNVPTFSSGSVEARFTLTGKGGFDTINTPTKTFTF